MSHFLGTPARSHLWSFAVSKTSNEAKKQRERLLSGPLIDVYVGTDRKHWALHKSLLAYHSADFDTTFPDDETQQSQIGTTLELPDDDIRGFALLVKWLYQGQLDDVSDFSDMQKYEYAIACHKLYQLCEKFNMIFLKNLAMGLFRQNLHEAQLVPDAEEINEIYRASPPGSPFKLLVTQIAARQIMDPHATKNIEAYRCCFEGNADFAVELVASIREMSGGILLEDPTKENVCLWHDHRDGSSCPADDSLKGPAVSQSEESPKIASQGVRRTRRPRTSESPSERQTTTQQSISASQDTSSTSQHDPDISVKITPAETPHAGSTPGQSTTLRKRPRKLERSQAQTPTADRKLRSGTANEARKLTPKARSRPANVAKSTPPPESVRVGNAAASQGPLATDGSAKPLGSVGKLHERNYVNAVVRHFNSQQ